MKHRKAVNARGYLDGLAITAEQLASYLTRKDKPPHVTLQRIANLAEKAQNYKHTRVVNGKEYIDNRPTKLDGQEKQREECLKRIWDSYLIVQESEIMHPGRVGEDETWGGAKEVNGRWTPEPVTYYGDALEDVLANELHGEKAQGIINTKNEED
tara:strand:- start:9 stop:473 length:465 start_codon:yes stop_codon:yes gene_type:complete